MNPAELTLEGMGRVRCSAWLGVLVIALSPVNDRLEHRSLLAKIFPPVVFTLGRLQVSSDGNVREKSCGRSRGVISQLQRTAECRKLSDAAVGKQPRLESAQEV